jgi:SAM-dependent methyltransferase
MSAPALGTRFARDGGQGIALTDVQREARDELRGKLLGGSYRRVDAPCPYCGETLPLDLAERDMYGLPHPVSACRGCGFVYSRLRLDQASLHAFYDGEYRRLDRGVPLPAEEFFALQRSKGPMVEANLQRAGFSLEPGSLVLDVGCGAGGILSWFREHGYRVLGVDPGSEYLAYGRRISGLELIEGDARHALDVLEDRGEAPALVIYEQVLEHVTDPIQELAGLRSRLDAGARLFVGVPGLRNIGAHYDSDVLRYLQFPHLSHFDLRSLTAVAARAGFRLVAGDEVVHAVFEPGRPTSDLTPTPIKQTLRELRALERRRRARTAMRRLAQRDDVAVGTAGRILRRARVLGR